MASLKVSTGSIIKNLVITTLLQISSSETDTEKNAKGPIDSNKGEVTANVLLDHFKTSTLKWMLGSG